MNDDEIDIVAEELAKAGGIAWHPGRGHGPVLRVVHERYRDRARAAIAALDRFRAIKAESPSIEIPADTGSAGSGDMDIRVGSSVICRPPGDRRAYACTVAQIKDGFAYLAPSDRPGFGWVALDNLRPVTEPKGQRPAGAAGDAASSGES